MKFPHLAHRDRDWQSDGVFAYFECRCGARRVVHVNPRMYGPGRAGWPPLVDRHGQPVADSRWHLPGQR